MWTWKTRNKLSAISPQLSARTMWRRVSDPSRPKRSSAGSCGAGALAREVFVAPTSRRLSWGRPAPTAEGRMPSGQPARRRRYKFWPIPGRGQIAIRSERRRLFPEFRGGRKAMVRVRSHADGLAAHSRLHRWVRLRADRYSGKGSAEKAELNQGLLPICRLVRSGWQSLVRMNLRRWPPPLRKTTTKPWG